MLEGCPAMVVVLELVKVKKKAGGRSKRSEGRAADQLAFNGDWRQLLY